MKSAQFLVAAATAACCALASASNVGEVRARQNVHGLAVPVKRDSSTSFPHPQSTAPGNVGDVGSMAAMDKLARLFRRDGSSSASSAQSTSASQSASGSSGSSAAASSTDSASSGSSSGSASSSGGSSSGTAKNTASSKGSSTSGSSSASSTDFDPRLPAGGVSMVTPSALAGSQFYKIGDWVTFAWNYTSLSVTPSAIDVLASCTANQGTYTLALNQSVEPTQKILWDTGAIQSGSPPLLTEKYTLVIYDAESSISATPKAGYLGAYDNFIFGMYTPQPYTPWADYVCPTCNSALSAYERSAIKVVAYTVTTTLVSFAVFTYNFMW